MANKFLPILVKLQKESAKESDAKQDNCRAAILSWHTTAPAVRYKIMSNFTLNGKFAGKTDNKTWY